MKLFFQALKFFQKRQMCMVSSANFAFKFSIRDNRFCRILGGRNYFSTVEESGDEISDDEQELLEHDPLCEDIRKMYSCPKLGHRLLLIQPRVKFGLHHMTKETAVLKMNEAVALLETLKEWTVLEKCVVPVASRNSTLLFGKGNLEKLKLMLKENQQISAIFIGLDMLSAVQNAKLEQFFGVPIFDRYQIVLRIFHDHAHTKEAKLQIALAEIPYLRVKMAVFSHSFDPKVLQDIGRVSGGMGETAMEIRRRMLFERELKLKRALEKLQKHRECLRRSEKRNQHPIVAVVGYTNCGKTTLIKSLTDDAQLMPEDKLFATLDVTLHAGFLPSSQKVLYVDTVGFISDVPTTLIQSFKATLEDVVKADLIIHVRDISHPDTEMQKKVVLQTLSELQLPEKLLSTIIEVGNKVDLLESTEEIENEDILLISAIKGNNLADLVEAIETNVIKNTDQQIKLLRVPNGGKEYRWLCKEVAIRDMLVDETDFNYLIVEVVISSAKLGKFIHCFGDQTITVDQIVVR